MKKVCILLLLALASCKVTQKSAIPTWTPYDESDELAKTATHESQRMRFKLIQSRNLDKNELWKQVSKQLTNFSAKDYEALKPFILEQDIPTLQAAVQSGKLTYEKLTQWYLYRIATYENDRDKFLNNLIAINPNAVAEARQRDKNKSAVSHPIYGMPIILKDNINLSGLPTTAGAQAFSNNISPKDAFIVDRLQDQGAIFLAKANLSEWANFMCLDCPNGYSAMGGQTLNPYGRKRFDTGGSSSGSGSTVAANYAVGAVGTETSGSILSPSSANSLVGLKPTTGLLSRGGIVPISSTFDTPGPMTRTVVDAAILLSAMTGEDPADPATKNNPKDKRYWQDVKTGSLKGIRFGAYIPLLKDSVYAVNIEKIKSLGGTVVEIEMETAANEGFSTLLNADMQADLPSYIKNYGSGTLSYRSVADILAYNRLDSTKRMPYGQGRIAGVTKATTSPDEMAQLRSNIRKNGVSYFEKPMQQHKLDVVLSINNRSAGLAAAANYPCLTVPMGYKTNGEPIGMTFIARPFEEDKLLKIGFAFEQATKARRLPDDYK
ncbi:amidase [Spirosoma taeanense]|uniref:Amidase n=1 Tax=Spirosoma taeanense TaxID=2735870 RepID=A0A6M5Y972_9BACT|nr:amidase family protein [Spirosoma taeanense]QJW89771.1 amidase [Spirosoma taeanense]